MQVGILGAGQLGRMLALAAAPLDIRVRCLDPAPDPPAAVAAHCITAAWDDDQARRRFLAGVDVVTYEFENVPVQAVDAMAEVAPLYPSSLALATGQDRLLEKTLFRSLGIDVPPFVPIEGPAEISAAAATVGLPIVVKTRRMGYDGRGQSVARSESDLRRLEETWPEGPAIVERLVSFDREISVIAVRGQNGDTRFYPVSENVHDGGILRFSMSWPDDPMQSVGEAAVRAILDALGYVGVLAVEFFVVGGRLLANEMAPRVHNSGHWTIEGAVTSQFENHIRAIAGLPLGDTSPRGVSAMVNLVGTVPTPRTILEVENAHLHLYGKSPRPGRKVGHVTICADDRDTLITRLVRIRHAAPV